MLCDVSMKPIWGSAIHFSDRSGVSVQLTHWRHDLANKWMVESHLLSFGWWTALRVLRVAELQQQKKEEELRKKKKEEEKQQRRRLRADDVFSDDDDSDDSTASDKKPLDEKQRESNNNQDTAPNFATRSQRSSSSSSSSSTSAAESEAEVCWEVVWLFVDVRLLITTKQIGVDFHTWVQ